MAGVDAGDRLSCPSCGETVLQKAMIPVLGEDGTGIRYLCVACARLLIVKTTEAEAGGPDADEGAAGPTGPAPDEGAASRPTGPAPAEPATPRPA